MLTHHPMCTAGTSSRSAEVHLPRRSTPRVGVGQGIFGQQGAAASHAGAEAPSASESDCECLSSNRPMYEQECICKSCDADMLAWRSRVRLCSFVLGCCAETAVKVTKKPKHAASASKLQGTDSQAPGVECRFYPLVLSSSLRARPQPVQQAAQQRAVTCSCARASSSCFSHICSSTTLHTLLMSHILSHTPRQMTVQVSHEQSRQNASRYCGATLHA